MLDGRIYRAAFVPVLLVVAIAGFSLGGRAAPLGSTLAPDAFSGARAYAELRALAARFPERRPGSQADARMARYVAGAIRQAGGASGGGFQIAERRVSAVTIDGRRTLVTVVAQRPGSTGESPVAILAHRDAAKPGSQAELSATAALIELARVFGHSQTRRTIVLVSTSGGTGGYGGAADFAAHAAGPLDAAVVLGDLGGTGAHKPFVAPFSSGTAVAPDGLVRTLDGAISQEVGTGAGDPGLGVQLAHLAAPLGSGEQAPLLDAGIPAALVQVDGERGPSAGERVSVGRLQSFGRAVLSAVYALDESPTLQPGLGARLLLGHRTLPSWAVRLLVLALLAPPALACIDGLARARRRKVKLGRWIVWTLSCACPFFATALFAILLGALGLVAAPAAQPPAGALATQGSAAAALAGTALVLALALAAWPALARRLSLPARPAAEGAGAAAMAVLLGLAMLVWLVNPFACLLLVVPAHIWLWACDARIWRPRAPVLWSPRTPAARARAAWAPGALAAATVALGALPLVGLVVVYAHALGLGPLGVAESAVLALAGGQVGPLAALLWSVAFGCLVAVWLLRSPVPAFPDGPGEPVRIVTRGPVSYAGPGSLGGTESALRR